MTHLLAQRACILLARRAGSPRARRARLFGVGGLFWLPATS